MAFPLREIRSALRSLQLSKELICVVSEIDRPFSLVAGAGTTTVRVEAAIEVGNSRF